MFTTILEIIIALALTAIAVLLLLFLLLTLRMVRDWQVGKFTHLRGFTFPGSREYYRYRSRIYDIIDEAESRFGIRLTWAGREMLAIPIIETDDREGVEWDEVYRSVNMVVEAMASDEVSSKTARSRGDSISVIRGFYNRFCKIPPFCDRRG
jgi:hypothetical protein